MKKDGARKLREALEKVLDLPASEELIEGREVGSKKPDYRTILALALVERAARQADVSAFKEIRGVLEGGGKEARAESGRLEELIRGLKKSKGPPKAPPTQRRGIKEE
jgi:hypothetical protein